MRVCALVFLLLSTVIGAAAADSPNLCPDPSIEAARPKNQFGVPFALWSGWIFEGSPEFRNGRVARAGAASAEIVGCQGGKVRLYTPTIKLEPGRYRFALYLRGLDVGPGQWGTVEDLNFGGETYHALKLTGTFGWTRVEIVQEFTAPTELAGRIGLWGPGRLWVDDAVIQRVDAGTQITATPIVSAAEHPIDPPGALDPALAVRCPDCGYRNMPAWGGCYACGAGLSANAAAATGPDVRLLASFEDGKPAPFGEAPNCRAVAQHASDGTYSLQIDKEWASWDSRQDWSGYDYWKADVTNTDSRPVQLGFEVHDDATTDYWTRVNYWTVLPPGRSTVVIPTDLYVGEKSRPGRRLDLAHIKRLALVIGDARAPVFFDNLRLERDRSDSVKVPGLLAYSFGPGTSPPMRGFTAVTPSTQYSPGRGYGLLNARVWRAFDMLQPDPLYQVGICIEGGGFAVDLPNGWYHVFVNLDSPSGFWGEYQLFDHRSVKANGVPVVEEAPTPAQRTARYFRFADVDDSPLENTFDKYQTRYFSEKQFDAEVRDGRLYLEFEGASWANFVSALVIYPTSEREAGARYLGNLRERRRFAFDNYFKRVLPDPTRDTLGPIPPFAPTAPENRSGLVLFCRDWMVDTPCNAVPRRSEVTGRLAVYAAAGQMEPIVFSAYPLRDLGPARVVVGDLVGPNGARIPASAIRPGVVSHRISRVTMEGTVYTISPRFVLPRDAADLRKGVTTTFWMTMHVPPRVRAGLYRGVVRLAPTIGKPVALALEVRLFSTRIDPLDVPAGPWGCRIDVPWSGPEAEAANRAMFRKCLQRMHDYGLTACSGIPTLALRGWRDGKPDIDFSVADWEMAEARSAGMKMVVNYNGGIQGFDNYFVDEAAMRSAGFSDYAAFLSPILQAVREHAQQAGWIPFAYNLCDEPLGDAVARSAANARAWRKAAGAGVLTTGATSIQSAAPDDPHLALGKALMIADLNGHDEPAVRALKEAGSDWAFYNGGDRWTFGAYMYKCARQFGMRFRLSWHWNASAGDPYYALDCREDDYSWCAANARGELVPSIHFERDIRAGIDDYRAMATLDRLCRANPGRPAALAGRRLLDSKLAGFKLGDRDHNARWPVSEYRAFRLQLYRAIEAMDGG